MSKAITQEIQERLVNLQEQKDDLQEQLETVSYTHLTLPTTPYV